MQLRDFLNSADALRLGLWLGRNVPYRAGQVIASGLTDVLARQTDSPLYRTVYNNLSVVLGPDASQERIHQTVRRVFRHAGHAYFDLYHTVGHGGKPLYRLLRLSSQVEYYRRRWEEEERGVVIVTGHMSNLDLGGLAMADGKLDVLVLGAADPTSGYELQDELRRGSGIQTLRIDVSALRKSISHLRKGGMILTGMDRPDPFGGGDMLTFFGRPARLPVGHIRLAMQVNAPVVVVVCEFRPTDGTYVIHVARWIEMEHVGTREENLVHNAQRVLSVLEALILAHPEQWLMFYPVWEGNST